MEEVSQWFSVALGTVKTAYRQLKEKGYITAIRGTGAIVTVQFGDEELDRNIQTYFSQHKDAVMGMCYAFGPLFSYIQWYGLKYAKKEQLDELERLCTQSKILRSYVLAQHIHLIYGSLNNDLLLRMIWQAYLFFQAPFMSLPSNLTAFKDSDIPLLDMVRHCRRKDWDTLWETIASCQEQVAPNAAFIRRNYCTLPCRDMALLDELDTILQQAIQYRDRVFELALANRNDEAFEMMKNGYGPLLNQMADVLTEISAQAESNAVEMVAEGRQLQTTAMLVVIAVIGFSIALAVILGIYISNGISRPAQCRNWPPQSTRFLLR